MFMNFMLLKRTIPSILQGTEKSLSYAYKITKTK